MRIKQLLGIFVFSLIVCSTLLAQPGKRLSPKELKEKGELYFNHEKYFKALPYLLKYNDLKKREADVMLKIGTCYIETNRPDLGQGFLEYLAQQKNPEPKSLYYLARTHHLQHQFATAIKYYKMYLALLDEDDTERYTIKDEIKRCAKGMTIMYQEKLAIVENLGDKVNTSYDEFAPVLPTSFANELYFSSIRDKNIGGAQDDFGINDTLKGDFRSDILVTKLVRGEWSESEPLHNNDYNSKNHDVMYSISSDKTKIYYGISKYKHFDYGDIYRNNYEGAPPSKTPLKLADGINSDGWDGNAFFFSDSIMLLSSDREGGYGGKDLYITLRDTETGKWGKPTNLGKNINTAYDEDCPFLAADGKTLYFSSNSTQSLGGMDIFKTRYSTIDEVWMKAVNLGMPINSAGDDEYFRISQDALRVYFSSSRANGYGKRDLYVGYYKRPIEEHLNPALALNFPVEEPPEEIEPEKTEEKEVEIPSYIIEPLFYQAYGNLLFTSEGLQQMNQVVNLMKKHPELTVELTGHTDSYGAAIVNLFNSIKNVESAAEYIISNGIDSKRIFLKGAGDIYPIAKDKNDDGSENKIGRRLNRRVEIAIYGYEKVPLIVSYTLPDVSAELNSPEGYQHIKQVEGLTYKVQIKALTQMLDDEVLTRYPDALIESTPDIDIMRYSIGMYKTFEETEALRQKLIVEGFSDSFVVPYINGQRMNKEEIELYQDIYPNIKSFLESK